MSLLSATGQPADPRKMDAMVGLALEGAWFRRALHHGLTEAAGAKGAKRLARDARHFLGTFRSMRLRSTGPHEWCQGCPAPCRYGYEGELLAADPNLLHEVDQVLGGEAEENAEALMRGLQTAAAFRLPGTDPIEPALAYCAVGHAAAGMHTTPEYTRWLLEQL